MKGCGGDALPNHSQDITAVNRLMRGSCSGANRGCFVEGTLVWTDKGQVPIEKLKPGDMVLSQPEETGERQYKRIVNTFVHENKEIWHLSYYDPRREEMGYLYATPNHPFWIEDAGWVVVEHLKPGQNMEFSDGSFAVVYKCESLYQTTEHDIAFVTSDYGDKYFGFRIDMENGFNDLVTEDGSLMRYIDHDNPRVHRRVFNIEVEDFHTYYVGKDGLWAHNTNCQGAHPQ